MVQFKLTPLKESGALDRIRRAGPSASAICAWQHGGGEPTLSQLDDLLTVTRQYRADWIAGIGGGSVLDLAKAAAGLFHAAGSTV